VNDLIAKQLVGGMPDLERRLEWWRDNFRFRMAQAVGRLQAGTTTLAEFQQFGRDELKDTYYGIAETGAGRRLTRKETYQVRKVLKEQLGYWDRFCQAIADQRKALLDRGLEGDELESAFDGLYAKFTRRAQSYVGAIEAEGTKWAMAGLYEDGQWFQWDLDPLLENCEVCIDRDGNAWQMKDGRLPFYPKDGNSPCLWNCGCVWMPISRFKAMALRALGKLKTVFQRKSFKEVTREELERLEKGGPGSGWFAPPRGTHGPGSRGGKVREKTAAQMRAELKRDLKRKGNRALDLRARRDEIARQHGDLMDKLYGKGGVRERLEIAESEGRTADAVKLKVEMEAGNKEATRLWDKLTKNESEYWTVRRSIREGAREKLKVANPADFEMDMGRLRKGKEELQRGADIFASLVGRDTLNGLTVTVHTTPGNRGHYVKDGIYLPPINRQKRVVMHELGHWLEERDPDVHTKALVFLEKRTKGERAVSLRSITGSPGYRTSEITKRNKFLDPYMGKQYSGGHATEIVSMGIEYMYAEPIEFATKDPEYFDFMYDLMRGR